MKRSLLSLILVISVFLSSTFVMQVGVSAASTATSGVCGDNLTWAFDANLGTLTISGTGDMYNWDSSSSPWSSTRSIKKVIIENGVTSIGDYTFYNFYSLEDIEISDSVKTIGQAAFSRCSMLRELNLPKSITHIGPYAFLYSSIKAINIDENNKDFCSIDGNIFSKDKTILIIYAPDRLGWSYTIPDSVITVADYAFYNCENLRELTIPDSVTTVGNYSFYLCSALKNITIPSSLSTIGEAAFSSCHNLSSFDVDENSQYFCDVDGNLLSKDKTVFLNYAPAKTDTSYTVPDGVTKICNYAFYTCRNITSIDLPDSVKYIGDLAFTSCLYLTTINMPNSMTYIGNNAFASCIALKSIYIPSGITNIEEKTFFDCRELKSVYIPDSVVSIKERAFDFSWLITDVYYGGSSDGWSKIIVGNSNAILAQVTLHYNYGNNTDNNRVCISSSKYGIRYSTLTAYATVTNNFAESKEALVFIAFYTGNELLKIKAEHLSLDAGTSQTVSQEISTQLNPDKIKFFIWDTDGSITPLNKAVTRNVV